MPSLAMAAWGCIRKRQRVCGYAGLASCSGHRLYGSHAIPGHGGLGAYPKTPEGLWIRGPRILLGTPSLRQPCHPWPWRPGGISENAKGFTDTRASHRARDRRGHGTSPQATRQANSARCVSDSAAPSVVPPSVADHPAASAADCYSQLAGVEGGH
jgi:hypothetical protein